MNLIGKYASVDPQTQERIPTQWPDATISGRPYRRPATLLRMIGDGQFVVLDSPLAPNTDALIAALKPKPAKKAE